MCVGASGCQGDRQHPSTIQRACYHGNSGPCLSTHGMPGELHVLNGCGYNHVTSLQGASGVEVYGVCGAEELEQLLKRRRKKARKAKEEGKREVGPLNVDTMKN